MIKSVIAAAAAAPLFAGAAFAGPYVNVEANSGFTGGDYTGIGPSFVTPDGGASDTVISGKVGASVAATEAVGVYGEFAFAGGANGAENGYGVKLGAKYSF
jgi:hypothetical protein